MKSSRLKDSPITQDRSIDEVLRACVRALRDHYGPRLKDVIVYGSVARGELDTESDLDILVLLSPPFDYLTELRQIVDLLYPIQLESDRLISAKPAAVDAFEQGALQIYRNAKVDAVTLM